ncbi:wax ester/triacylglycerol synthase family O-acyltransferase [Blastococcus sp. MG754426]|nr:wax ester/triacylglycerol synthase family O-acyltransferase [Blastococcus sp. MG754426]MCF6510760.1 wax ester/triacylglycerol synthase family O-acyltransferase [Blastococcus sp. MG754427]MCF6734324.1 wax ester/triacylglycerol synthase family O-acyltransferase [Blastococcus sp. KM273129]
MNPLDAAFLEAEDEEPEASLAIASIAVFEGPPPGAGEFERMIAGRLPLVPRYRQKAREVPLDLGPPVWVDDPGFDLGYHLRRTALPSPGGDEELAVLMGRVMSARLDRDRPLWEYWLVEGLAGDRWALISKVHHCMVDGVSGTDLYRVILDQTPEPRAPVPDDWHPAPEPTALELTAAAALDAAQLPLRQARALTAALRHPTAVLHAAGAAARGLTALAGALRPAAASSLSGPPSAHRRFAFGRASTEQVGAVRAALGGTFNDVVLAAVTGGFRRLLLSRGELPTEHAVRTLVPVSVRRPGTEDVRDNEVSLLLPELPVHLADPVERLVAVRQHLDRAKAEHEAEAGAAVLQVAQQQPFPAAALPVRWAAHLPQRSVVTVTTNVPGPRTPLYALGRRLLEIVPYVPIASTLRTGVAIFSYCGQVTFGVTGDLAAGDDVWTLARGIEEALGELVTAAGAHPARRTTTDGT